MTQLISCIAIKQSCDTHKTCQQLLLAGMDRETQKPRGFAHVQFESVEGAAAAIAKSGSELNGRDLFIDSAQERPQSGAAPGGARPQRGEHVLHLTQCTCLGTLLRAVTMQKEALRLQTG